MILDAKFEVIQVELNDIKLEVNDQEINAEFGQFQVVTDAPVYDGPYSVTPQMEAQTLPTKAKLMSEDVTINEIPIYRVSNTSGGTTVYIANEV